MADDDTGTATGGDSTDQQRDAAGTSDAAASASDEQQQASRDDDALQKALRSERQLRAAAEKRLKQFEDAQKSESERERDARAAAERERDELRLEMRRLRIAAEFNLSPAIAERLRGDDDEAMREDAKVLVAEIDPEGDLGARRGGQRPRYKDPNAGLRALFGR
jgi:hypothetical protein